MPPGIGSLFQSKNYPPLLSSNPNFYSYLIQTVMEWCCKVSATLTLILPLFNLTLTFTHSGERLRTRGLRRTRHLTPVCHTLYRNVIPSVTLSYTHPILHTPCLTHFAPPQMKAKEHEDCVESLREAEKEIWRLNTYNKTNHR